MLDSKIQIRRLSRSVREKQLIGIFSQTAQTISHNTLHFCEQPPTVIYWQNRYLP